MYKNGESKVNIQSNIISYLPLEEWAFFYSDTIDFLTYGGIVIYLFFLKIWRKRSIIKLSFAWKKYNFKRNLIIKYFLQIGYFLHKGSGFIKKKNTTQDSLQAFAKLNFTVAANKIERFLTTMHSETISAQLSTDIFNFFEKRLQNGPSHTDSFNFQDFQQILSLLLRIGKNKFLLEFRSTADFSFQY